MSFYYGIKYNLKGVLLSLKTPKLLMLGILRFFVVLILTFFLSGLVLYFHDEILSLIWKMPESGLLIYLWKAVSWILSFFLAAIAVVLAYLVSQILFCVFIMDYMSRITEVMVSGKNAEFEPDSWLVFFFYLIKQEIPRAIIPILISLLVMALGLFTPAGPLIVIVSSITAAVFLAWDNTDLTPARQMLPFSQRFDFLKKNVMFHIGFGLLFLIPWLNIVFLSFAPVGATLYYIEHQK
ncbi:MAG: EI24 domain-containing protein [Proteobacteria bacterium]|nr:EI24 domain-containing protein [Pseudomonadota bacterium]MBU1388733.1 EI24 domain-containing protein [Pseudomonadota bacterium]MBU1543074.1 EI24 domain-containing protein [Pseudomonadota bacterium]MBU2429875.1 EI24 domain-containing protein [Pseudomonadota bacterium]MBU2481822.1 EI24 domain-containing protein [Pseudomonadota bacterium]